jgi:hypothetical protein
MSPTSVQVDSHPPSEDEVVDVKCDEDTDQDSYMVQLHKCCALFFLNFILVFISQLSWQVGYMKNLSHPRCLYNKDELVRDLSSLVSLVITTCIHLWSVLIETSSSSSFQCWPYKPILILVCH